MNQDNTQMTETTNDFVITNKQFKNLLNKAIKHNSQIMTLVEAMSKLKSGYPGLVYGDKVLTRVDLNNLKTMSKNEFRELKYYFTHSTKKKTKRRVNNSNTKKGFSIPILVTKEMSDFFRQANLGFVVPGDQSSGKLNDILTLTTNSITTRAILTPLFNIYILLNNLQQDEDNKQLLTSDELMDNYFRSTYQKIIDSEPTGQRFDKKGKLIPPFDPKGFRFASLQSIVKYNAVDKTQLDPQTTTVLQNPNTIQKLSNEQKVVSCNLYYYRNLKNIHKSKLNDVDKQKKIKVLQENYSKCINGEDKKSLEISL